jgi:dTDP-4-dehydrorhamnose reductase
MKIKILVSGATGQLGFALKSISSLYPELELNFTDRNQLDLALIDPTHLPDFLHTSHYDYYIHAAAYTSVDLAEKEERQCYRINEIAVKYLAAHFSARGTKFIYISSDYVYHSAQNTPFTETDIAQPKGVYATSKLAGEEAVKNHTNQYLIFRTSWVYGEYGKNFIRTMDRLGREKDWIQVVFDQIGSPTWVLDLANMLLTLIREERALNVCGTFNYSNEGVCSWYDLACAIMNQRGYAAKIIPVRTESYPLPAPRPPYSVMDKSYFKEVFNLEIPHWRVSLEKCLARLTN